VFIKQVSLKSKESYASSDINGNAQAELHTLGMLSHIKNQGCMHLAPGLMAAWMEQHVDSIWKALTSLSGGPDKLVRSLHRECAAGHCTCLRRSSEVDLQCFCLYGCKQCKLPALCGKTS
jgi:hypothetical protein